MNNPIIETGLCQNTLDIHRALASLQEELEAIDAYNQRAQASQDASLRAILIHNRDDEMEHAAMLMGWLRRSMPEFELQMGKFQITPDLRTEIVTSNRTAPGQTSGLGLGNLKCTTETKDQS